MPELLNNSQQNANSYLRNQPNRNRHTLSPNHLMHHRNNNHPNGKNEIKRHWFDDTTANSLERTSKRNPRQQRNGGSSTLPRMFKLKSLSRGASPAPQVLSPRSVTSSDAWETSCDSINFALNNSVDNCETQSPIYVKELPEDQKLKAKQFGSTYYDVRPRLCSPALLNAIRDEKATTNKQSPLLVEQSPAYLANDVTSDNVYDVTEDKDMIKELVAAMKELKELAEITRIIDEVDDEEWLLVFIGELQIHLNDILKPEPNSFNSDNEEITQEEKKKQLIKDDHDKKTLLKVTLDLIAYLKGRFANYLETKHTDANGENTGTLNRLRKLARGKKPNYDPFNMNKWQRKLSCLVITLDKFLNKMAPQDAIQCDSTSRMTSSSDNTDNDLKMATSSTSSEVETSPLFHYRSRNANVSSGSKYDVIKPTKNCMRPSTSSSDRMEVNPDHENFTSTSSHFHSKSDMGNDDVSTADKNLVTSSYIFNNDDDQPDTPTRSVAVSVRCSTPHKGADGRKLYYAVSRSSISTTSSEPDVQNNNKVRNRSAKQESPSPNERQGRSNFRYSPSPKVSNKYLEARSIFDSSNNHVTEYDQKVVADRHKRGGSLDRRTWKRERTVRRNLSVTSDDSASSDVFHVSGFSRICDVNSDVSSRPSRLSEFSIRVNDTYTPKSDVKSPKVIEEDVTQNQKCQQSMTSRDCRIRKQANRNMTSSSSQCNIINKVSIDRRDEELNRMKNRSDLLQRGLTEAREERDEKDRKIAVLESRVQRIKKMVESGRSERGSVEVQLERLKNIMESERRDSERQIKELEKKLKSLQERGRRDELRVQNLNEMIARLQQENQFLEEKCQKLLTDKTDLEKKLNDVMMTSLEAKRHNRRLQNENVRLEEELSQANEKLRETHIQENMEQISEAQANELTSHQDYQNENYSDEQYNEELKRENEELIQMNQELRERLSKEQESSDSATDCFRQQIEFLNNEVSLHQETAQAQKKQYEEEIDRILTTRASTSSADNENIHEITRLESQIEYQQTITTTLYIENERLRKERDTLKSQLQENAEGNRNTNGVDFGCQVEDTSYTRMRAFDFYSQEAHRNGLRLVDRGRQLQEESMRVSMRARKMETEISMGKIQKY